MGPTCPKRYIYMYDAHELKAKDEETTKQQLYYIALIPLKKCQCEIRSPDQHVVGPNGGNSSRPTEELLDARIRIIQLAAPISKKKSDW